MYISLICNFNFYSCAKDILLEKLMFTFLYMIHLDSFALK